MKFYEAVEIVKNRRILSEEEGFNNIKNVFSLAKNSERASLMIKNDLAKISKVVENKIITQLTWKELGGPIYLEAFNNYYEFADGCSKFLDRWEIYNRAPTVNAKAALLKKFRLEGYAVDSKASWEIAAKGLRIYWELTESIAEMAKQIRIYNSFDFVKRNKWQLNIPQEEFHFKLKQAGLHWKEKLLKNS